MTSNLDFLTPSIHQIRHSIKGIDDSYNNEWDILAELLQNSVDAINSKEFTGEHPRIDIFIDSKRRIINVRDNGCGIDPEQLPILLRPFSSNKTNGKAIGEKGVGLKFALFQSNKFIIKSGNERGTSQAIIDQASAWKKATNDSTLEMKYESIDEKYSGTDIYLEGIESEEIFNLNARKMEYLLRTKTAVGNTSKIWKQENDIKVELHMIDINGDETRRTIKYLYWLPTEGIENDCLSLKEFEEWLNAGIDRSDSDKRSKLKDKVITHTGHFMHQGSRRINFWACFVPTRSVFDTLAIKSELATEQDIKEDEWIERFSYVIPKKGIFTSVKGMPTAIEVDHPSTGFSGYWSNIFIIFEDNWLKFDIGRKSIHVVFKEFIERNQKRYLISS